MLKKTKFELYLWKKWIKSIFVYPKLNTHDENYNQYWHHRHLALNTSLNSFQEKRVKLASKYLDENSSVTDIGAGNGSTLIHLGQIKKLGRKTVVDISDLALEFAKKNGLEVFKANISSVEELSSLPETDYILFFEVLEHIPNSEEILTWAVSKADKGVLFSVPNTGFFTYRLRLLFGKFPLQWRLNPSEHIRFWTAKDMKWWLNQLGFVKSRINFYEGPKILINIWPRLFAQGLFIYVPSKNNLK